jgi:membrane protein DedA with SNARE-associated domain
MEPFEPASMRDATSVANGCAFEGMLREHHRRGPIRMMEELLPWLQQSEGPLAYLVLGLASLIEYVFPPFPGDTVALFGVFLAATAGYGVVWVYLVLNLGALGGGMAAYGFGRWIAERREHRTPRFLRGQQARKAIDAALARFERHGAAYLALNRFVPALRSVFFIAAGMAKLPAWKVALWGTVSAAAWNALLLTLGWAVGSNYARLEGWVRTYSTVALIVVALAAIALVVKYVTRPKDPNP